MIFLAAQVASDSEWAAKQWGLALPQDLSGGFLAWVKAAASSSKWPDRCKIWLKHVKRTLCATHELRLWHCESLRGIQNVCDSCPGLLVWSCAGSV